MSEQKRSLLPRGPQADVLRNPGTPATVLLAILIDSFGTECLNWEPETLRLEVDDTWNAMLPPANWDKVFAAMSVLTSDVFENSLEGFINICNGLSGSGNDFNVYDPATIEEICLALAEISLLDPPEQGFKFNAEIQAYLATRLDYEGFMTAPKLLSPYAGLREGLDEPAGIDPTEEEYKSHYDSQTKRRLEIDLDCRQHLKNIIDGLKSVPLGSADAAKTKTLAENASKSLGQTLPEA